MNLEGNKVSLNNFNCSYGIIKNMPMYLSKAVLSSTLHVSWCF